MKRISSLLLKAVDGVATLMDVLIGLSLFIDTMEKDHWVFSSVRGARKRRIFSIHVCLCRL